MIQDKVRNVNGILTNVDVDFMEQLAMLGLVYRYGSGIVTLAGANDKLFMGFITPAEGETLFVFPSVNKTGNELELYINEGGVYTTTGGAAINGFCLDRYEPHTDYMGAVTRGLSTAGAGVAGGLTGQPCLIPGTSVGATRNGGAGEISEIAFFRMKPATQYVWYLNARGTNTTCCMTCDIAYIPE